MLRRLVFLATAAAVIGVCRSAAASPPTVAQIAARAGARSSDYVLANAFDTNGNRGHAWIDVETGAGRWVTANGTVVTTTVTPLPDDPTEVTATQTVINPAARTWYRTSREEPVLHVITDGPLGDASMRFRLLGVQTVDGRQAYHLRSTTDTAGPGNTTERADVWFSTGQALMIRATSTTRDGAVASRVDNWWLPRTPANLALTTAAIPTGFKQVSAPCDSAACEVSSP